MGVSYCPDAAHPLAVPTRPLRSSRAAAWPPSEIYLPTPWRRGSRLPSAPAQAAPTVDHAHDQQDTYGTKCRDENALDIDCVDGTDLQHFGGHVSADQRADDAQDDHHHETLLAANDLACEKAGDGADHDPANPAHEIRSFRVGGGRATDAVAEDVLHRPPRLQGSRAVRPTRREARRGTRRAPTGPPAQGCSNRRGRRSLQGRGLSRRTRGHRP